MSTATSSDIIAAIDSVIGDTPRPVSLHEPLFSGNEAAYVNSCITEGWVSSVGAFVDRFEKDLAQACGAKHAVVLVNGTCALHAALCILGVLPGDEVIVPSLTFIATANAVSHAGAIPHFVEVEEASLGMDPIALQKHLEATAIMKDGNAVNKHTGRIIRALVPVHVFGHPCQLDALAHVTKTWNLAFIEDSTEALGSLTHGKKIGSEHTGIFSFNGNKILTTGGGGAIVTQDSALHQRIKHLTSTAKEPHKWAFSHDAIGWNYRMPNLNAALGCAQLEQLQQFLRAKRALAAKYIEAFENMAGIRILREPKNTQSNYWLVTLLADHDHPTWRDETLQKLHDAKLFCRPIWNPLHTLPIYAHCPKTDLRLTESLSCRIINLPSSVKLGLAYV